MPAQVHACISRICRERAFDAAQQYFPPSPLVARRRSAALAAGLRAAGCSTAPGAGAGGSADCSAGPPARCLATPGALAAPAGAAAGRASRASRA
eukprot:4994779-Alexandrium_andersonii.AAC.1